MVQICKEYKLSLFADNIIIYIKTVDTKKIEKIN